MSGPVLSTGSSQRASPEAPTSRGVSPSLTSIWMAVELVDVPSTLGPLYPGSSSRNASSAVRMACSSDSARVSRARAAVIARESALRNFHKFSLVVWGIWLVHRKKLEHSRMFLTLGVWAVITPFLMNTAGWMLTESGRQPWIVQGVLRTADAVTTRPVGWELVATVVTYVMLGAACAWLLRRLARTPAGDET